MRAVRLGSLVVAFMGLGPALAAGDPVKVMVPGGGGVFVVTQREGDPVAGSPRPKVTTSVTRESGNSRFVRITKLIKRTGLDLPPMPPAGPPTDSPVAEELDTDGVPGKDSTRITIVVDFGEGTGERTKTFDFLPKLTILEEKEVITAIVPTFAEPGVNSDPKNKVQSADDGKGKAQELKKANSEKTESGGQSVAYDAASGILSFADDVITDTGVPGDPLVGAALDLPDFTFDGFSADGAYAVFNVVTDEFLTIHRDDDVYWRSNIDFLYYDIANNAFEADLFDVRFVAADPLSPFFSGGLTESGSPFLANLALKLDPASPMFDSRLVPAFGFFPDVDFFALTNGLSESGESAGINLVGAAVPEPATVVLLGLACIQVLRRRRHLEKSS
jgi:hypothetical protein